jgi:hypothetical protein
VQAIAEGYFSVMHRWLPFVSRRTFFSYLVNPLSQRRTELALLMLCMKLSQVLPGDADFETTYCVAKQLYRDVEGCGVLSLQVLQASLLIALFEVGHAIYPAAYLTVGACARYGIALGIDRYGLLSCESPSEALSNKSWNEIEEGRRVWWTILHLDRFLAFNDPTRPLATEDPRFETFLPVDDTAWDEGTSKPSDAVRLCDASTLNTGNSARLAQTTYLLSQAIVAIKMMRNGKKEGMTDETAQLRRTLVALVHAADCEAEHRRLEFCPQSALAFSVILLLEQHRLVPDATLWAESCSACDRLIPAAMSWMTLCPVHPFATRSLPIFTLLLTHQVASTLLRLGRGAPEGEHGEKLAACRRFLEMAGCRWKLAGLFSHSIPAKISFLL